MVWFVVCWLLLLVDCSLSVVCCGVLIVVCWMSYAVCCRMHVVCSVVLTVAMLPCFCLVR